METVWKQYKRLNEIKKHCGLTGFLPFILCGYVPTVSTTVWTFTIWHLQLTFAWQHSLPRLPHYQREQQISSTQVVRVGNLAPYLGHPSRSSCLIQLTPVLLTFLTEQEQQSNVWTRTTTAPKCNTFLASIAGTASPFIALRAGCPTFTGISNALVSSFLLYSALFPQYVGGVGHSWVVIQLHLHPFLFISASHGIDEARNKNMRRKCRTDTTYEWPRITVRCDSNQTVLSSVLCSYKFVFGSTA